MISLKTAKGFTLIEVVLAISILATLTVLIATVSSRALKSKRKIQIEVEDVSALRDTMRLIKNDINQAYNHYDYEEELLKEVNKVNSSQQQQQQQNQGSTPIGGIPQSPSQTVGQNPQGQPQRENIRQSPATQFEGSENQIHFVTKNNGRISANDLQADFIEVGYLLKDCRSLTGNDSVTSVIGKCLYRRQQKILDSDITTGGIETVVLENVTDFSLKYMGEDKTEWNAEWKIKGQFPEAVEVNLEITKNIDDKEKKYSLQYIIPLHFPNNQKPSTNQAQGGSVTGGTTSGASQQQGGNL